jgi:AraC-like DNA-binding protein
MSGDTLSDVLRAVRLKGAVFFDVETNDPWVAEAPQARSVAAAIMPDSDHVIEYHVVTSGTCWATLLGRGDVPPVRLKAGDVVAFPQGDAHVMSSAPGMRGEPDLSIFQYPEGAAQLPLLLNLDGGGHEHTHLVCGFLGCDTRPFNPLLDALPPILHLSGTQGGEWLNAFTRFAVMEVSEKRAGGAGILSKLGELMFIELVRRYVESLPDDSLGWLGGLRDRHVGRALNMIHAEPSRAWTLNELASAVGLSRSTFAERFTDFVGFAPMQYLQRWRLQIAASALTSGKSSIAEIAVEIGYESEAAFGRAFKKVIGTPPAEWRDQRMASRSLT